VIVSLAALAATVGLAAPARAQPAEAPQAWGETYKLPNGLRVILAPDRRFPEVTVLVRYHVGARQEPPGRSGIAHLLEHLTFLVPRPPIRAAAYTALFTVSSGNGGTSFEHTEYYTTSPSGNLRYALWAERWRMGIHLPNVAESDRRRELDVVKNERRQRIEIMPYREGRHRLWTALFPQAHPFHEEVIGSMADLSAISVDEARAFFTSWYGPNNATLAVVGDFDAQEAKEIVAGYYADLPARPVPPLPPVQVAVPRQEIVIAHDETYGRSPRLHLAWHGPPAFSAEHAAGDITAIIVAGLARSRLALVMPEAVGVGAYQDDLLSGSVFHLVATPMPGVSLDALKTKIDAVLAGLAREPPTPAEVEHALRRVLADRFLMMERTLSKAELYVDVLSHAPKPGDPLALERARYGAVTPEMVQAFVRTWLAPEKRVALHAIPKK
jgi:predicted Zn-dependent peptidase